MSASLISRRTAIGALAGGVVSSSLLSHAQEIQPELKLKGNIKQSVSAWCYLNDKLPLEDFCKECVKLGLVGLDLVNEKQWPTIIEHGLIPTMVPGAGNIANGTNRKENHAQMLEDFRTNIEKAAKHKIRNVITFSGERKGMSDEEGAENSILLLKEAAKIAEDNGVIINIELLNSKVDHKDYMCDHSEWGVQVCEGVGSPAVKLLYDIYHMQIMEGDIIRTIKKYHQYFGHYHTGGNPGRNEIDETQELNYPPIMQAIVETGDDVYVAHEFVPKRKDRLASLKQAVLICDV
ncbi:MAG: TIM barrel protein [bacterium]|jgi:hydroxypyruvate isomerase|nr:TIM barrel protein [bacterium]